MEELISGKYCVVCKRAFVVTHGNQKCCSSKCSAYYANTKKSVNDYWKIKVFNRDGFRCIYCGKSSIEDSVKLNVDHVYPRSKGGTNDIHNLVTSCQKCNANKNYMVLGKENILRIWKRNIRMSLELLTIEDHEQIKFHFDRWQRYYEKSS